MKRVPVFGFMPSKETLAALNATGAAGAMQYASGYTLDLYCDQWTGPAIATAASPDGKHGWNEFPHVFTGESFAECAKAARARGWSIHRVSRTATCPKCNKGR